MDALCPKCEYFQKISARQLRKKHGQIICPQCKYEFNPHASSSNPAPPKDEPVIIETYPWQKTAVVHTRRWVTGTLVAVVLFVYQVIYFTGYPLSQNAQLRPWFSTVCTKLDYLLPTYRNLSEFTTIGSALEPIDADTYHLQISFINHADFAQRLPDILVSLHNLHGGLFAQRTFTPEEYSSKENTSLLIASSDTADIDFFIAVPEQDIGGYSIELK